MVSAYSVYYRFRQHLGVPASEAYHWSTSFTPQDLSMMGLKGARRVERVTSDTFILTDTIIHDGAAVTKKKLVRLNPSDLSWTSTHLSGPNRHSQFIYEIVPDGEDASWLVFTGLTVFYSDRRVSPVQRETIAKRERMADSASWRVIAKEMEGDLRRERRHEG